MSTDSEHPGSHDGYTAFELRDMDEAEARDTLTVNEYERWEQIQDLYADAEQTRERWEDTDETIAELSVSADPEQLGTPVEVFGNDLIVRVQSDDREFRQAMQRLDEEFGDSALNDDDLTQSEAVEAAGGLADADQAELADCLTDIFDAILLRWDGHEWRELPQSKRESMLAAAEAKWGVDGLFSAWVQVAIAVGKDREELSEQVESFLGAERPGGR